MNIEDLTLKQIRQIQSLGCFAGEEQANTSFFESQKGKWVICRTRNEGINFGRVLEASEHGVILEEARRIWYHKPKDRKTAWYEGVAVSGVSEDSKMSCAVSEKVISEDYSLTACSEVAVESLKSHPSHEQ